MLSLLGVQGGRARRCAFDHHLSGDDAWTRAWRVVPRTDQLAGSAPHPARRSPRQSATRKMPALPSADAEDSTRRLLYNRNVPSVHNGSRRHEAQSGTGWLRRRDRSSPAAAATPNRQPV